MFEDDKNKETFKLIESIMQDVIFIHNTDKINLVKSHDKYKNKKSEVIPLKYNIYNV